MSLEYSQVFDTAVDTADDIIAYIMEKLGTNGFPNDKAVKIRLGIEEAVVNICSYAYIHNFPVTTGEIYVKIEIDDKEYQVEFKDKGIPYNPLQRPDPALWTPSEDKDVGGLGIHLIKQMTDDISYRYDGIYNILKLKINI